MQKLKLFLIGTGFFWIFAWSVFGSILGAKINLVLVSGADPSWFGGVQKSLLTAAHSHMNNMAVITIIMALTLDKIRELISKRAIRVVCFVNLLAIPLFGVGMLFESFYPPSSGNFSTFSAIIALGGILYMLSIAVWSSFFILAYMKKSR